MTKEIYEEKLNLLKNEIEPVFNRYKAYKTIFDSIESLKAAITFCFKIFSDYDGKLPNYLEKEKKICLDKAKENQEFIMEIMDLLLNAKKYEGP